MVVVVVGGVVAVVVSAGRCTSSRLNGILGKILDHLQAEVDLTLENYDDQEIVVG